MTMMTVPYKHVMYKLTKSTSILKVLLKQYKSPTGHTKFKHATSYSVKKGSAIPNFELELDLIVFKL